MNNVNLIGNLSRDPELRYITGTGTPVANFSIAVNREFSKDGKKEVDFLDIQVWGKSAENCANYISKGSKVAIQGSIRIEEYQNQAGEKRKSTKINANRVEFLNSKSENKSNENVKFQAIQDSDLPF